MTYKAVSGYILCPFMHKKIDIDSEAVIAPRGGFLCECGRWTGLDYKHEVWYRGVKQ